MEKILVSNAAMPWFVALLLGVIGGCGPTGLERFPISGRVTYRGQPVAAGVILFEPDGAAGNAGPAGFAEIRDGHYATLPERGIVGGPHIVKINGGDGQQIEIMRPYGNVIPKSGEYRTRAEFPHEPAVRDFEIPRN